MPHLTVLVMGVNEPPSCLLTRLVVLVMLTFHLVVLVMLNVSFNCCSNA